MVSTFVSIYNNYVHIHAVDKCISSSMQIANVDSSDDLVCQKPVRRPRILESESESEMFVSLISINIYNCLNTDLECMHACMPISYID